MRVVIFHSSAEYCDFSAKLTIKRKGNQVRTEMWDSNTGEIDVKTKTYFTKRKAYEIFRIAVGDAILGGWSILNAFPQRETWETKRSK